MAQLRQDYAQFVARDIEVVVVGPEERPGVRRLFAKESLPFIGLPDPTASVLSFGQEVNLFKLGGCRPRCSSTRPGWRATSTTATA